MNASLGRPVADLDDYLESPPDVVLRAAAEPAPAPARSRPGAARSIIAAAAIVVVGLAGYWMLGEQPTSPPAIATGVTAPTAPAGVPGFAEMYLASYLTGTSEEIGEFMPGAPSLAAMTPASRYVTGTATMEVATVAPGYWRVVVAAAVLSLQDGAYHPAGLQYFQIGVVDDGGRLVAVALPARVAGPAPRPVPPRALQVADGTPADEDAALVGDFLEALLTDRRDIRRYLSAQSDIAPISPAPYDSISITSLALYADGSALATVDAQSAAGAVDSMQYIIRFSAEGPSPAVAALLAGPPAITRAETGRP